MRPQRLPGHLRDRTALGALEQLLLAQRIDALFLSGAALETIDHANQQLTYAVPDSRYRPEAMVASALAAHVAGTAVECAAMRLASWRAKAIAGHA